MIPVWGGGAASAEESAVAAPSRGAGSRGKKRKKKKKKTATTGAAGQLKTRQQDAYMTSSWHTNSADALRARSVDRPRHLSKRARQRKSRRESELDERTRLAARLSASSSSSSSASASAASSSSFWRVPTIESECIIDGQSIASIGVARVLPLRKTKFGAKQSPQFRFNGNALCRAVRALRKHGLLPQVMLPFYYCFEDKKHCVGPLCSIAEMRTINQLKHECPVHFVKSSGPDKFDSFFEAYVLEEVRRRDNCFLLSNSNFDHAQKTGSIDEMFVASYVGRVYESSEIDHPNSAKINILHHHSPASLGQQQELSGQSMRRMLLHGDMLPLCNLKLAKNLTLAKSET